MTKSLVIAYGSQTGNAQDIAERVWRKCKYYNIEAQLTSFDNLTLSQFETQNDILLCVCSTTGQGDTPDNMTSFWNGLMKKTFDKTVFNQVEFGVIGLGDSSYEKYNFIAKKLYRRLLQLGGKALMEPCLCDEQHPNGIETTFNDWINDFWSFVTPTGVDLLKETKFISMYKLTYLNKDETLNEFDENNREGEANESHPFEATLLSNERITPQQHWQSVHFIELDCSRTSSTTTVNYSAGDVLMLRPSNTTETINKFLELFKHLNINMDDKISIDSDSNNTIGNNFKRIKTVSDLIKSYFDLNSIPRMSFFEILAKLSEDETEKEKLIEFTTTSDGLQDLYDYCYKPRRTIIEIFYDFHQTASSIKSLDVLLNLVPEMKPRCK
jgi:sulfite reductase alpha subunit-like flavoprotein